eukprot:g8672.t1
MSVSIDQSPFSLPDFTSPAFHASDLPFNEKRSGTDHVFSSASFTCWRKAKLPLQDKATESSMKNAEVCDDDEDDEEEHTLEACDSAFLQGHVKSAQLSRSEDIEDQTDDDEEGLTFPKNEISSANPLIPLFHQKDKIQQQLERSSSSKSLYRPSIGQTHSSAVTDGWVSVEFWIIGDRHIEVELTTIDEALREFYILEKEREEQIHTRNEIASRQISLIREQERYEREFDTEDEDFEGIPKSNEYNVLERKTSCTRATHVQFGDRRILRLNKSLSMTTLIRCEAPEPSESAGVANEEVPVMKTPRRTLPVDFGFTSLTHGDASCSWSTSTPKLRRNFNKQIKRKWQPVSRFVLRRCCARDGGSSSCSGSTSRGRLCSLRRTLYKFVCCAQTVSSDEDDATSR